MENNDRSDATGAPPPGGALPRPEPPPDAVPVFEPPYFEAPYIDPPPDYDTRPDDIRPDDTRPDDSAFTPHVQRQMLFARFLDDAEVADRQLAVTMAERARRIDDLRLVSQAIAADEESEDAAKPPELRVNRNQEVGWSIRNRAKTELATELAMAYNLGKNAARHLLEESETLVHHLPLTLEALEAGAIRYEHAKILATTAWSLPEESRAAFETELVPLASTLILPVFRTRVRAARERIHAETMAERHEKAAAFRSVAVDYGEDGMGYLTVHDSNEVLAAIYNRVTDIALVKVKDDPRTLAQRRTDVTTELLLKGDLCAAVDDEADGDDEGDSGGGDSGDGESGDGETRVGGSGDSETRGGGSSPRRRLGHGITAQIHIEVPVLTLLGLDTTPATLEGSIPIDPVTARKLVADSPGFYRLLTDPVTGSIVAFDDKYRHLPASLRRAVELVDGDCTGPWCAATANESDGHHPDEWAQTHDTSLANSALLCAPDHRLVHNTRWTMRKLKNGDKQWVSPCGRIRRVTPLRRLSPAFVEALAPDPAPPEHPDSWHTPVNPDEVMPF